MTTPSASLALKPSPNPSAPLRFLQEASQGAPNEQPPEPQSDTNIGLVVAIIFGVLISIGVLFAVTYLLLRCHYDFQKYTNKSNLKEAEGKIKKALIKIEEDSCNIIKAQSQLRKKVYDWEKKKQRKAAKERMKLEAEKQLMMVGIDDSKYDKNRTQQSYLVTQTADSRCDKTERL